MTLDQALHILAELHTQEDDAVGFVVHIRSIRWYGSGVPDEYIQAWKVVREHLHLQTEPPQSAPVTT